MLAEFAGTTVLLLVEVLLVRWLFGPRSAVAPALLEFVVRLTVIASVTGIVVGLLIVSPVGRSSGGHFNPAVTATFWLLRGLPGVDAAAFIGAQLVGSVAGVLAGRGLVGPVAADPRVRYAAIRPAAGWSWVGVFVGEAVSLAVLMLLVVVFLTSERLAPWTPLAVGACVALLIVVGGLTSGGSFNPARQFGPAVMAGGVVPPVRLPRRTSHRRGRRGQDSLPRRAWCTHPVRTVRRATQGPPAAGEARRRLLPPGVVLIGAVRLPRPAVGG